jgi:beta-ureidopropionase
VKTYPRCLFPYPTQALSRTRDGLLIGELDLNLCRQIKDKWVFQMTQRLDMYAEGLAKAIRHDFQPQIVRKGDDSP